LGLVAPEVIKVLTDLLAALRLLALFAPQLAVAAVATGAKINGRELAV
jgi:hypothetical protein